MKKSRIALSVILGSVVLVSAVAVSIFVVANDTAASSSAQTADVAKMSPASLNENAALPVQSRGVIDTIEKTSYEPDRIDLSWDAADDADGYSVYICDRDSSEDYVKAKDVTEPEVSIGELKSGTQYWIKIVPYTVIDGETREYPESVKALADAGNEVMNHSSDHAHFSSLSDQQIAENITACNEKIAAVTGVTPALFRCPYGEYDDHVIQGVQALGMTAVQWDVERSHITETY